MQASSIAAALAGAAALWSACVWSVAREDLLFLSDDGQSYTLFSTLRSDLPARELYVPGEPQTNAPLFFYPPDRQTRELETGSLLKFGGGNYALLGKRQFAEHELRRLNDGSYEFRSWDGLTLGNGHFGKWNAPDPFEQFTYAWVLPSTIEVTRYESNRSGDWRQQANTLVWTGRDVNDIAFTIGFTVSAPKTITVMPEPARGVRIDADSSERITLDTALLFSSGSHEITEQGAQILNDLAERLSGRNAAHIIVEGHTDNQPLKPYLRSKYPSNWELSAMRATHVVRFLADNGVKSSILEARAFGEQHPVASNETEEGRARNRRIELLVRDRASDQTRKTTQESGPSSTTATGLPDSEAERSSTPVITGNPKDLVDDGIGDAREDAGDQREALAPDSSSEALEGQGGQ